jgi:hypothetical protein
MRESQEGPSPNARRISRRDLALGGLRQAGGMGRSLPLSFFQNISYLAGKIPYIERLLNKGPTPPLHHPRDLIIHAVSAQKNNLDLRMDPFENI